MTDKPLTKPTLADTNGCYQDAMDEALRICSLLKERHAEPLLKQLTTIAYAVRQKDGQDTP